MIICPQYIEAAVSFQLLTANLWLSTPTYQLLYYTPPPDVHSKESTGLKIAQESDKQLYLLRKK